MIAELIYTLYFIDSQPIAGLQALSQDGQWRYIRYYPNHIIADLGDCMEFLTGGILKASPHRGESFVSPLLN